MEVKTTLKPGQNGTKRHLAKYGDQLVCVRYRYDRARQKRQTTVELIVDEQNWIQEIVMTPDKIVSIRIGYEETELREMIKTAGAWWDANEKVWRLKYKQVLKLGLEKRIDDGLGF